MPSLSERTLILSAGKSAKGLGYLAFSVGAARLYTPDDYAAFLAWWMVFMTLVPIAEGGFTAGLYHSLPRLDKQERNGLTWRTFWFLAAAGLGVAALVAFTANPLAAFLQLPGAAPQLQAVAIYIGAALPIFALQGSLLVDGGAKAVAWMDVLGACVTGAALFVPVWTGASPVAGLWALSAYGAMRTLLVGLWLHKKLQPRLGNTAILPQLRFAGQISSSRAMGVATKQMDRYFVGALGNPAAFSVYSTGAMEIPFISVLTGSAATVLAPEISSRFHAQDTRGALRLWHESIRKIALFLFPLGAAAAVLAQPLFYFLYGPRLASAALVFQVFALALPVRAAQYGSVLLAAGDSKRVFWGSLTGLSVNTVLCLALVPRWPALGAAVATVISVYCVVAVYLPPLSRLFHCSLRELFPWAALGRTVAATALGSLAAFLVLQTVQSNGLQLIAGLAAFGAAAIPAAFMLGAVQADDKRRLGRFFSAGSHA